MSFIIVRPRELFDELLKGEPIRHLGVRVICKETRLIFRALTIILWHKLMF